jgi:hypothetical protein
MKSGNNFAFQVMSCSAAAGVFEKLPGGCVFGDFTAGQKHHLVGHAPGLADIM